MGKFIADYWSYILTALIGILGMGTINFFINRFKKGHKVMKTEEFAEHFEPFKRDIDTKFDNMTNLIIEGQKRSDKQDTAMRKEVSELRKNQDAIRDGVLSDQKVRFLDKCIFLLRADHVITTDEWIDISTDYRTYKSLGGNHEGDTYYDLVKEKYEAQIKHEVNKQ